MASQKKKLEDKYVICDKNQYTVLASSSKSKHPDLASQYRMHIRNMLVENLIFCPTKANTSVEAKTISCNL